MAKSSIKQLSPQTARFRINPIEVAIFSVVTLVFINSVYNLFYDRQGFHLAALAPMSSNPITENAAQASTPAFANLEIKCDANPDLITPASKVRLIGALCGSAEGRIPAATDAQKLVKTLITNNANKFTATVFTDVSAAKYSTDYIPLNAGKNPIQIEFVYQGGKSVVRDLEIVKN